VRIPGLIAVLTLALAVAGCIEGPSRPGPLVLRPLLPSSATADTPVFQVRLVRLLHRVRADAPAEDLWRLLGSTNLPHEKRTLWETNDLRLGDGARLAADRLNDLATETPDRSAQVSVLQVRENADFLVPIGNERAELNLLWSDATGQIIGRRFDRAQVQFRLVCRTDPDHPEGARIALVPEVIFGPEEAHLVPSEAGGYTQRISRSTYLLSEFAAEVRLAPDRLLVLGGQATADLSLGGGLFHEQRGPDVWDQTLIVTVQRTRNPLVGKEGPVPLVPGAGSAKPSLGPAPRVPAKAAPELPPVPPPPAGRPAGGPTPPPLPAGPPR
jgi:hypothetical protein